MNVDDKHIIVYDGGEDIFAVVLARFERDHLYLDTLEANEHKDIPENNGASLLMEYMDTVASLFHYNKIIFYSYDAPRLIKYYEVLGYKTTGNVEMDPNHGKLIEMEKYL